MVNQLIPSVAPHRHNSHGNKKHINRVKCQLYRSRNIRLKNKIRKLSRYVKTHPNDKQTEQRLKDLMS